MLLPPAQIFTVEGTKHIGIYAKRRVLPGEELSYDYKAGICCFWISMKGGLRKAAGQRCLSLPLATLGSLCARHAQH